MGYVRDLIKNNSLAPNAPSGEPLKGVSILDVGCGGGIMAEAFARLGKLL